MDEIEAALKQIARRRQNAGNAPEPLRSALMDWVDDQERQLRQLDAAPIAEA
jgi:hypothetical protein